MPVYVDDFLGGTISFGAEEVGAYFLLLSHQWAAGEIDSDPKTLERIARCEYGHLTRVLSKFEKLPNGNLLNAKCDQIRRERSAYIAAASKGGKKTAAKRWGTASTEESATKEDGKSANSSANKSANSSAHRGLGNIPSPSPSPSPRPSPESSSTSSGKDTRYAEGGDDDDPSGDGEGNEEARGLPEWTPATPLTSIVKHLRALRPEYKRIAPDRWLSEMKIAMPRKKLIEGCLKFVAIDANQIDPFRAPASYLGAILQSQARDGADASETKEDFDARMERIRRER